MSEETVTGRAKGGKARADALPAEKRREIARNAAAARWSKNLRTALYTGDIDIGGFKISCAVLEDGTRILTQSDMMRALGRARQAKGRAFYKSDVNLPAFLTAGNLKDFIPNDLYVTSSQIEFKLPSGQRAYGYKAEILTQVCEIYLKARDAGALVPAQMHVARQADLLMRGLANVGIVALIDEATGYQEVRGKQALQALLDAFLRKELAAWAKRFPDEFYEQIFRLRGWQWKGRGTNPPQVVASYTKDIVYARLAPGIIEELERKNPSEHGKRRAKHHQWLTEDVGHPALAQHLHAVITLMRISKSWDQFKSFLDQAHPRRGDTMQLPLMIDVPSPAKPIEKLPLFEQSPDASPAS
jgi:hypothetical protein